MGMLDGEKYTASNVLFSFLVWIQSVWIVDQRGVIFLKDISNIFSMVDADVLHRGYVEWYNKPINTIISPKVNSNVCDNLMKWWNKLYNMSIKPMHWLMDILYKFFFSISSNYDKDRGMRNRGMIRFQKKTSSGKGTRFQRKFLGLGLRSFD